MKEELRKYLKETFHATHRGFVKYFLLRTSGEAIPTNELSSEVGCCTLSIDKWDSMLMELGIINQEGAMYCRNREYISYSDYYTYNMYNNIASMYRTLIDLAPFGIEKASKRGDTNSEGTELADIFSKLQEGLQAIDIPITEEDFIIDIAPIFEVDTDNEVYIKTMLMIARYSVL